MKKLKLLPYLFIASIMAISCTNTSDDVEVIVPNYTDLLGTWELESYSYTGYATYDTNGVVDTGATYIANSIVLDAEVDITSNPNEIITSGTGSLDVSLNFIPLGITTNVTEDSVSFDGNGTWTNSGDTITISFASFGSNVNNSSGYISSITDSTATIMGSAEFSEDTLNVTLNHHINYTLNLTKD
ncbi:MAG: hypothetical protein ACPG6V_08780 [Flavobacteriales bacterium]